MNHWVSIKAYTYYITYFFYVPFKDFLSFAPQKMFRENLKFLFIFQYDPKDNYMSVQNKKYMAFQYWKFKYVVIRSLDVLFLGFQKGFKSNSGVDREDQCICLTQVKHKKPTRNPQVEHKKNYYKILKKFQKVP